MKKIALLSLLLSGPGLGLGRAQTSYELNDSHLHLTNYIQEGTDIRDFLKVIGYIKDNPMQATDIYTEQCSVSVNAQDLATMAATLANGGKNPVTGKQVMKAENVPEVLAVMATAGLYDDSGKWLYRTGLPGQSGVGGGIIAGSRLSGS